MLDKTDLEILKLLEENARLQWKEIGEKVHMTGQAVAVRIRRLEDLGVIEGYTVRVDRAKLGNTMTALVSVMMKSNDHFAFQHFIKESAAIVEAHRISGKGCYWLKVVAASQDELNKLLDKILTFGNYSLNISIGEVK